LLKVYRQFIERLQGSKDNISDGVKTYGGF
jgi:hypothetical protein